MKIGILTFHYAHNYGAVLQCYALQEYCKSIGHDVFVIDYCNPAIKDCYGWFAWKRFINKNISITIKELLLLYKRRGRYLKFERFIHHFNLISCTDTTALQELDWCIVGSDQVWNVKLTRGFDNWYWGQIAANNNVKVLSYAASMEQYWGKDHDEVAKSFLKVFSSISVREESLKEILDNIVEKPISVTVDPTLLINRDIWDKIAIKPFIKKPYLFLYQVRNSIETFSYAKEIAAQNNLELVCLSAKVDAQNTDRISTASPAEFLGLIKYASIVIACSFHGVIFSIIYEKKFVAIKLNDGRDARYVDFLNNIELSEVLKSDKEHCTPVKNIDYSEVNKKIQKMSTSSKQWLMQNIK